jgi:HK97 family phage portal protein
LPETIIISGSTRSNLSAINVNSFSMLSVPAFARAMDFLSGNLASFPVGIYQTEIKSTEPHPLDRLFTRRANPAQTSHAFLKQWYFDGEHRGNGYAYIRRASPTSTDVIGLYNLLPDTVTPFRVVPEDGGMFDALVYYWHSPSEKAIPAADILHYKPFLSYDGLVGYSPEMLFAGTFRRAQALEVLQTKWLVKGSIVKASIECPAGITKETQKEIVENLRNFRAETGDKDIILLSGGAKLVNQTGNSQQLQLIEQDAAVVKKISQITGVSQQFLFETAEQKYNAASVEAAGQDIVRFTFRTRLEGIEDEISTKLLREDELDTGLTIRLDTSALIRGDTAVEMTVATQGVAGGLLTRNEGRTAIGEPEVADASADKLLVPSHVATVENPSASEAETHAATPPVDRYAAFRPVLADAAELVETKTAKALETASRKPAAERMAYTNALAETQAAYTIDRITPGATAMQAVTGTLIDVAAVAERYAGEVRRRAAGQPAQPLATYLEDAINAAA